MGKLTSGNIVAGRYRLLELVAAGGMGEVHRAQHLGTDRVVAVKVLHETLVENDEARARFEREAKAAGRVCHDNVCEVLDFGVAENGEPFLVMPLLKGDTLSAAIRMSGPMPPDRASDITVQVLAALSAAHRKGVLHRDLKPDNIFLTQLGDREDFVKVLDFGLTRYCRRSEGFTTMETLTDTGAVLGTPCYMAPEQARGDRGLDGRADLWAVGAVLYEMLTGCRPVTGDSAADVLWNIWSAPIAPPRSLAPHLSPALEAVVMKALARDPVERFSTAEEMSEAVRAAAEGGERRNPAATLPTGLDLESPRLAAEIAAAAAHEPRPSPSSARRLALLLLVLAVACGIASSAFLRGRRAVAPPDDDEVPSVPPRSTGSASAIAPPTTPDPPPGSEPNPVVENASASAFVSTSEPGGDPSTDRTPGPVERGRGGRSERSRRTPRHLEEPRIFGPLDAFGEMP